MSRSLTSSGVPVGGTAVDDRPARAAWCYGSPGISPALWLAGEALDDPRLPEPAVSSIEAVSGGLARSSASTA